MTDNLNSVKTSRAYHHGDLRPALLAAAEALIAERGVDRFSLRETARRAGVSPAAPAHHFGDARGLLTALAADSFRLFGDALAAAADKEDSRIARIRAQGVNYVNFALAHPARFDLMWRGSLIDAQDPEYRAAGQRAYRLLDTAVRGEAAAGEGLEEAGPAAAPSLACWAMVHGFARLALDGVFGSTPGAAERAAEAMLPLVLDHLDV
jgi:AcrR family transcriptional regulator